MHIKTQNINKVSQKVFEEVFDIIGLHFFKTHTFIKNCGYDIIHLYLVKLYKLIKN